jgi:hypothetical protein
MSAWNNSAARPGLPCIHTRGGTILDQRRSAILRDASGQVTTWLYGLWAKRGRCGGEARGRSGCSSFVCARRGRGLGEPGCILLDENVTCRRGESSASIDGPKANMADGSCWQ